MTRSGWVVGWFAIALLTLPGRFDAFWYVKEWVLLGAFGVILIWWPPGVPSPLRALSVLATWVGLQFWVRYASVLAWLPANPTQISFPTWTVMPSLLTLGGLLAIQRLSTNRQERWWAFHAWLCIISGLIIGGLACLQYVGWSQWVIPDPSGASTGSPAMISTLGNQMLVGNYLAMVAPACLLFREWRWAWLLFTGMILLTGNQAGILALGTGLLAFFLVLRRWRWALGLSLLLVGGLVFGFMTWSDGGRWAMWTDALRHLAHHQAIFDGPLTGLGLGSVRFVFMNAFPRAHMGAFHALHNEYLEVLFELGVIGLGLLLWALWQTTRQVRAAIPTRHLAVYSAMTAATATVSLVSFPFQVAPLAAVGVTVVAGTLALSARGGEGLHHVSA